MENWKDKFPKNSIYYETKNGILYCGDCLEIMKEFPKEGIDLILTDPPYGLNKEDWDYQVDYDFLFEVFKNVLSKNGQVFIFAGWSFVCDIIRIGKNYLNLKDWIIWDRVKGRGTKKSLVSTREDILWWVKDLNDYYFDKNKAYSTMVKKTKGFGIKNKRRTRALSNVWTDISPLVPWSKIKFHPTQKPLKLFERIILVFSESDSLILDCFIGGGTTAYICELLNRKWIGIEKSQEYCLKIRENLSDKIYLKLRL